MSHLDPEAITNAAQRLSDEGIDVLRLGYSDLVGGERGRDLVVRHLANTASSVAFCKSVFATTPLGDVVPIDGGIVDGLPDILAEPDLDTIVHVPWEPGVAHAIADIYYPDGSRCGASPRAVLQNIVAEFTESGLTPILGPELEFYVLEEDATAANGFRRYGEATGNVYTAGLKGDPENLLLRSLRQLADYQLDVVAANHEFASGQFEINMWHSPATDAADRAFRFKSAVQELARRENKLATFMGKPFNGSEGSGFHLHFSCVDADGTNIFDDPDVDGGLSATARSAIAGILKHAPALAALNNPTVNAYKRFGPDTLAPWLVDWGYDNRSAMLRVPPERGPASRLELRLGDASANPYLAIASTIAAALLGIREGLEPAAPLEGYGYDPEKAPMLPQTLKDALDALEADTQLCDMLGEDFTKAFLDYKRDEVERYRSYVTDWEFQEYTYHL